ncbi:MAG: hypothetical protein ACI8TE_000682 [Francisella sp.]|jgi:hypothetical protein
MNTNVKQILSSILVVMIAVSLFILLAPFFVFIVIFIMIFSFFIRRKIIKQNPNLFKNAKMKKGRVIDQEDIDMNNSNPFNNNQNLH